MSVNIPALCLYHVGGLPMLRSPCLCSTYVRYILVVTKVEIPMKNCKHLLRGCDISNYLLKSPALIEYL